MAEERVQRRLAAILAADVVGYSRLMGEDEQGTLDRLKALRREVFEPGTKKFGGRTFKITGDGALVEFRSAVDAVRSAVDMQRTLADRGEGLAEDRRIRLRIGISLGDVIVEGSDLYGNGVNVAARMEGLAEPGGICISGNVHDQVRTIEGFAFEDLGAQQVKNVGRPVPAFRVRVLEDPAQAFAAGPGEAMTVPERPSIAVLPFENMSGDPEQEYFADGIAEDIITALSRFRWFFVIARNSSFTYKGKAVDIRNVGRELGVRYVLEGSVRRAGNRLRITAQLIEAATGNHIWAEKYDGEFADVFELQDRITEGVVGAVEPSVRHAEIERAKRKPPDNLDAYDNYLRALPHVWANTLQESDAAIAYLDRALTLDPSYAAAHGLAALCHWMRHQQGGLDEAERVAAIRHARAVLGHDTDDSNALAFAGITLAATEHDFTAALGAVDRAVALSPNSSRAHTNRAGVLMMAGRYEDAFESATTANRLSPLDPMRYGPEGVISVVHYANRRFPEAIEAAKRSIQSSPGFGMGHALLIAGCVRAGRQAEAQEALRRLREVQPHIRAASVRMSSEACFDDIVDALREAGLPE